MKLIKAIARWIVSACAKWWYGLRAALLKRMLTWRARLKIHSLRDAIRGADRDKAITGRKNMVVYNTASGEYEPLQKRLLKAASRAGKNRSNKALTEGRKRELQKNRRKKRLLDTERVLTIEKKSLYVTD